MFFDVFDITDRDFVVLGIENLKVSRLFINIGTDITMNN